MSEMEVFDENNLIKVKEMIGEKYPSINELNFHSYPNCKADDFLEDKILQAWFAFEYFRAGRLSDFNKTVRYSIKKFNGKIFDGNSINEKGDLRKLLYQLYWVLTEHSLWDERCIFTFMNEDAANEIDVLFGNDGSYLFKGMKDRVFTNVVHGFLNQDELKKVYDLVEGNNNLTSNLRKENLFVNKLTKHVKELKKELDRIEPEYQGRLLTKSFFLMLNGVDRQLFWSKIKYNLLIFVSIIMPVLAFLFHIYVSTLPVGNSLNKMNLDDGRVNLGYFLSYVVPFLSLEIMLFYFVRLSYRDMNMLNAQKLQVEHRLAVSRFIRSYARQKTGFYENNINDTYKDAINKSGELGKFIGYPEGFENLIFSPIQANGENIPSALDSVNSIAELAGKIMSAKK